MKLKEDYSVHFVCQGWDHGIVTVPKGTRVTHQTAMGYDENYHFVDEFGWVEPWESDIPKHGLIQDLKTYGINVPKEYIDYEDEQTQSKNTIHC